MILPIVVVVVEMMMMIKWSAKQRNREPFSNLFLVPQSLILYSVNETSSSRDCRSKEVHEQPKKGDLSLSRTLTKMSQSPRPPRDGERERPLSCCRRASNTTANQDATVPVLYKVMDHNKQDQYEPPPTKERTQSHETRKKSCHCHTAHKKLCKEKVWGAHS